MGDKGVIRIDCGHRIGLHEARHHGMGEGLARHGGGFGKIPLDSSNVEKTDAGHRIQDLSGAWHDYPA